MKKSRYQAGLQALRKRELDRGRLQPRLRSERQPTTEDSESVGLLLLSIAKATGELVWPVIARLALWAFASFLLLLLLDALRQ